ncbi:hypothetical protein JCM11641_001496 [Rhodosporidiobolus odoratus]
MSTTTQPHLHGFHLITFLALVYILASFHCASALPLSGPTSLPPPRPSTRPLLSSSPPGNLDKRNTVPYGPPAPVGAHARLLARQHMRETEVKLQKRKKDYGDAPEDSWKDDDAEDDSEDDEQEGDDEDSGDSDDEEDDSSSSSKKGWSSSTTKSKGGSSTAKATSWSPSASSPAASPTAWQAYASSASPPPSWSSLDDPRATNTAAGSWSPSSSAWGAAASPTSSGWWAPSPSSSPAADSWGASPSAPTYASPSGASYSATSPPPGDASTDCTILDALFVSLGGSAWLNTQGWTQAQPGASECCNYYGVQCNSNGRVTALDLADNGLNGPLDQRVFGLGALGRLNMSDNALTGQLPDLFAQTPILKTVYLESNQLSGPLPTSLLQSPAITNLHLTNNTFVLPTSSPLAFPNAGNLSSLYLASNYLEGPLGSIGAPANPGLSKVVLDYNRLSGSLPDFAALPQAQIVSVRGNRLEGAVANLQAAANLIKLDLSSNQLSGAYPDPSPLAHLTYYGVASNSFTSPFPSTPAPPTLSPSSCKIDNAIPSSSCPSDEALSHPDSLASICGVSCKGGGQNKSAVPATGPSPSSPPAAYNNAYGYSSAPGAGGMMANNAPGAGIGAAAAGSGAGAGNQYSSNRGMMGDYASSSVVNKAGDGWVALVAVVLALFVLW